MARLSFTHSMQVTGDMFRLRMSCSDRTFILIMVWFGLWGIYFETKVWRYHIIIATPPRKPAMSVARRRGVNAVFPVKA